MRKEKLYIKYEPRDVWGNSKLFYENDIPNPKHSIRISL